MSDQILDILLKQKKEREEELRIKKNPEESGLLDELDE